MARRRSARIASTSKTPSKADALPSLSSLAERDESPEETVAQSLDAIVSSPVHVPRTPADSTPAKPPMSEMHPSKVHPTMAPPSSGLRLGFTDIKPAATRQDLPGALRATPSKVGVPSSPFTFRLAREATERKLGPEAQRMMDELREEALKIKADLAAKRELEREAEEEEQAGGRKIAKAKGKAGRYSAAHIAEFKKMDSIENHPSAFRAQTGRTPLTSGKGIKRSQSRANLQEPETPRSKQDAAFKTVTTTTKIKTRTGDEPPSPSKRVRQHIEDDASSSRPTSRDGSMLPRPKSAGNGSGVVRSQSSLASLMTPTKSSLARVGSVKTPSEGAILKSPSVSTLGGLARSTTTNNLTRSTTQNKLARSVTTNHLPSKEIEKEAEMPHVTVRTPSGRFDRVKSLLRGTKASAAKAKSAIPLPAVMSKTPAPPRVEKELPALPMTTPRHKLTKHSLFTPLTAKKAAAIQNSPSPVKSGIPRSKTRPILGEVHYPTLDEIMAEAMEDSNEVLYPDLSQHRALTEAPVDKFDGDMDGTSAPSTFTFRSDHTIRFGSTSPGFGSASGKSGIRQVRPSIPTSEMPGSFPLSIMSNDSSSPNKENTAPRTIFQTFPHGMTNKKRHRVSTDEEDAEQEAAQRAAKKRRQESVPEGDALVAPDLVVASGKKSMVSPRRLMSPGFASRTPSPKKKAVLSLSRLNMLSRPKLRK
ncbi:hypothetical protein GQ53DRAFT_47948 [Thozetella sp. PMI_491]|nr:hypothetical protein GQ53DRAFT_47948 [Thozetella sp. PMI_491]